MSEQKKVFGSGDREAAKGDPVTAVGQDHGRKEGLQEETGTKQQI